MSIIIKSPEEVALMRQAGKIVAMVLKALEESVKPGIRTSELDDVCVMELAKHNVKSTFKGYKGYPAHLCVSVNNEVVHGIPGDRILTEGDIVSLDVGTSYKGFQGDAAITVGVGEISLEAKRLLEVTQGSLLAGIAKAVHGSHLGDISATIQRYVEERGYSVVREYTGHGIGREMHEDPPIPNFGIHGGGPLLKEGMTLAIEPMVNIGGWPTRVEKDGWKVVTADGSLSAHFEHTIVITKAEPEILTAM